MSVVIIIGARCHFTRTRHEERKLGDTMSTDPLSTTALLTTTYLPKDKVLEILKSFELKTPDSEKYMQSLQTEIGDYPGLPYVDDDDQNKIVYAVPMNYLPTETVTEGDDFTVIEISNTVIRIHQVRLPQFKSSCTFNSQIPKEIITGIQMLDFIAECAKEFYRGKFQRQKLFLGFVFSFPLEYQHDLNEARFTTWNSGFRWDHLGDKNVQDLLRDAFRRKKQKCRLTVTVILSNAAGTLLSVVNKDRHCRIGVSLADGFHACYLHKPGKNMMISNIVLGALGKNGCLEKFNTEYDRKLDLHSINPGQQILGKMVSMAYIGEIVRLVLTTLVEKNLLFSSDVSRSLLNTKDSLTANLVSLIESERSEQWMVTENVIKLLEIKHYTEEDVRTVGYVVRTVLKRAAHLAATALAVLVNQTDIPKVTIAVDGNLRRNHPIFFGLLRDKTQELVKSEKEVEFKEQLDGSAIGAALAATVLKSSHPA